LHQHSASDAFEVVRLCCARKACRHHPYVGFGGEELSGFGVEIGRDHHLDKLFAYRLGNRRIELAVEGDDASERSSRVGGESVLIRLQG